MKETGGLLQIDLTNDSSLIGNYHNSLVLLGVPFGDAQRNTSALAEKINECTEEDMKKAEKIVKEAKEGVEAIYVNPRDVEVIECFGKLGNYGAMAHFIVSTTANELNQLVGLRGIGETILLSDLAHPTHPTTPGNKKGITFYGAAELSRVVGSPISLAIAMSAAIGNIIGVDLGETRKKEMTSIQRRFIASTNLLTEPLLEISERIRQTDPKGIIQEVRGRTAKFFLQGSGK